MLRVETMTDAKKSKTSEVFAASHILSASYFIAGVALLALMTQPRYIPVHLGILGILNIIVSYSISKMKRWALYLCASTSTLGLVFGGVMLAIIVGSFSLDIMDILILLGVTAYLILSIAMLIYLAIKRNEFS